MDVADLAKALASLPATWALDDWTRLPREWGWAASEPFRYLSAERRTFVAPSGWRWSAYSQAGAVRYCEVVLRFDRQGTAPTGRGDLAAEFEIHAAAVSRFLDTPEFAGGPETGDSAFEDWEEAVRLARWAVRCGAISLGEFAAESGDRWLSMLAEPPAQQRHAEPIY